MKDFLTYIRKVMKSFAFVFFISISTACAANPPDNPKAIIPVSVSHVEMDVVGSNIVRIIQHNMELNPIIQFEVMERPEFKVVDSLTLSSLPFNGEDLSLKESSGSFVESLNIHEHGIDIKVEYFYLRGGAILLNCTLPVKEGKFLSLSCTGSPVSD